ncbi:glycosyltransferase [Bacillus sp. BRMEA1]|uniref:glycosyltransferase family 4 protein n=1 Tax=Neobacillus endophyticus TaxID=2738405 RepID=UPI00156488EB|nr:glycosyltransferase [Neobacillus endophyticus]NRD76332.1 glycosyltransferase [Neobacillus endophyticus]
MNIFYVSSTCSSRKFKSLFEQSKAKPQQQIQKFHRLFIKGLEQLNNRLCMMSVLPINKYSSDKKWFGKETETEGNIQYIYLPLANFPILKHLLIFITGFITCLTWGIRNKRNSPVLICDVLNVTSSISALLASKLLRIKTVAIVTDIPGFIKEYSREKHSGFKRLISKIYELICHFFMYRYDSYIILTEQMNELVNPKNKPFVVIEGMVDIDMGDISNKLEEKYEEKVILYAGALYEKYGVKKLIEAFMNTKCEDARLWLFGSGEMENEIKEYEKADHRLKYFGVLPNEVIVMEELKATLLVNPRPSQEEFTKYSFPSKNMEYMASGTPVLTTKLPGMPKEYYDYIYLIEDEGEEGMAEALELILSNHKMDLFHKGKIAKEFVLKEKNNRIQAKRFMETLL